MDERTADRAIAKLSISDCCNWRLRAVTTAEVTPEGATVLDAEEEEGTMDEWCAWLTHPDTFHLPVPQVCVLPSLSHSLTLIASIALLLVL